VNTLNFIQRYNPNTEEFGFSSGQFEISENFNFTENTSFIVLPREALKHAQG